MIQHSTVALRAWTDADLALLRQLNAPEMTEHLGGPESDEAVLRRHQRYLEAARSDQARIYTIVLDPGANAAGNINYWEREWRGEQVFEMGWGVLPEHQGRGIAGRAVALAVAHARAERRHRFLHAFPSVQNAPSNAICRKAGFTLVEDCDFEYPPGHQMRCNDWRLDLFAGGPG